jgi:hypothetical protein
MVSARAGRFLCVAAVLGLTVCHCYDEEPDLKRCDERDGVAMGVFIADPPVEILFDDGSRLVPAKGNYALLHVPLQRGRSSRLASFALEFVVSPGRGTSYGIDLPTVESELLVTSSVGDRFLVRAAEGTVQKDTNVCTRTKLDATIEVLGARGRVDSAARTVDGSFWRRIAIDVDWPAVGCGLGSIRGRVVADLTAALGINCEDTFQRIGPIEGVPPDAGSADGEAEQRDAGN